MRVHEVSTDEVLKGLRTDTVQLLYEMELGQVAHVLEQDGSVRTFTGHRFAVPLLATTPVVDLAKFTDKAIITSGTKSLLGHSGYWVVKDETGATVSPLE